jgi:hypothetical protein
VVRLWSAVRTEKPLAEFRTQARAAAFSADGAFLAAAGNGGAIIVQLK